MQPEKSLNLMNIFSVRSASQDGGNDVREDDNDFCDVERRVGQEVDIGEHVIEVDVVGRNEESRSE